MRRALAFLVAVTAMGTLSATAQGTFNLINSTSTRVMDACGFTYITADMGYRVELLYGTSADASSHSLADGGFVDAFQWWTLDCPVPLLHPVSSGTQVRFEFDSRAGYWYKLMFRPSFDTGSAWEWEYLPSCVGDGSRMTVVVTNDLARVAAET